MYDGTVCVCFDIPGVTHFFRRLVSASLEASLPGTTDGQGFVPLSKNRCNGDDIRFLSSPRVTLNQYLTH